MINRKKTGERIWELKERSGYTTLQLCQRLGMVYPSSFYRWASGELLPSLDYVVKLAKEFGVSIEEMLVVDDD